MSASRSFRRGVSRSRAASATVATITLGASLVGLGLADPADAAVACPAGTTSVGGDVCEKVFTANAVWTPPAGTTALEALLVGAGGAGSANGYGGGGGEVKVVTLDTTGAVTVTVGVAGSGSKDSAVAQAGGVSVTALAGHDSPGNAGGSSGNSNAGNNGGGGAGGAAPGYQQGGPGVVVSTIAGSGLFAGVSDCYGAGGGAGYVNTYSDSLHRLYTGTATCSGGRDVAPAGATLESSGPPVVYVWTGLATDATTVAPTANSGGGGAGVYRGSGGQSVAGANGRVEVRFKVSKRPQHLRAGVGLPTSTTLAAALERTGRYVVLAQATTTREGQRVAVAVRCTARGITTAGDARLCWLTRSSTGRVTLYVRHGVPLRIQLSLVAPGTDSYLPLLSRRTYSVPAL